MLGHIQYDWFLRHQSKNPNAEELTEHEKRDLELWDLIRANEVILRNKIEIEKIRESIRGKYE